ncbi:hypothetical protein RVR_5811 [Actinacidiphila reveromycinica]|uniref:Uncharacterized protein n=1 Tax=Actinacidiphila reveromycinica TaxID=659352 RepID=A0A7U3VPY9_9ACTN|nr:hypothetical protein [Streptomyces sp. SN-593]BBA99267.1 hypothetical protein RVR_5811 [Streptomyces sp. SN-593]
MSTNTRHAHKVSITSDGPTKASVVVDGVDLAAGLTGLTLTMGVGQIPQLTLDVQMIDVTEIHDIDAQVLIPDTARNVLTTLGWTPPHDSEVSTR